MIACLAGLALTNQQIAHLLSISLHTVKFHLRQIYRKLNIKSRVRLARIVPDLPADPTPQETDGPRRTGRPPHVRRPSI
jgi:predicted ArsR family transcriptional regulator